MTCKNIKNTTAPKCAVNPYLPGWEYVPDGEPHVFNDRVYVFGSHDQAGGTAFCQQDYVAWSAPTDDLSDWRCEGVIYRKDQDPHNTKDLKELWAPDVCKGTDGRYYLYYCCAFVPEIGIAVCDQPAGKYEFYDYVRDESGEIWSQDLPFDPGILFEDPEHIWLYTGFGSEPSLLPDNLTIEMLRAADSFKNMSEKELLKIVDQAKLLNNPSKYSSCLRLAPDMKTVIALSHAAPAKQKAAGTSFEEHPFFEASSIRRIHDTYYFIYSSLQGHELCYATSQYPDRDFIFRGVIVSNADLGYKGNSKPIAYYGNNHGSIEKICNRWYIFYHRHTNNTMFSRQGCIEPIQILEDGSIPQVEVTSCGPNNAPLPASGSYSAHICCNLTGPDGACLIDNGKKMPENTPYITEELLENGIKNQYVYNMQQNAVCGVKYLQFKGENGISLMLRGNGVLQILLDDPDSTLAVGNVCVDNSSDWTEYTVSISEQHGVHAVYFKVSDSDSYVDFSEFRFGRN